MSITPLELQSRRRAIRVWLLAVAALVFAVAFVGGATRLTGSGLSIVEWRPVTGAVPPLSEQAWQAEFEKYKTIPQFKELNHRMSLAEFKVIYWWEWGHRLLGRLIGVVFLLPFLWLLWRGWIEPGLRARLWAIFGLGALQGAVGWWMVASGLAERVSVSQYRLAFHLTLACIIFALLVWTAQRLAQRELPELPARIRRGALIVLILVLVQIYLGALVAGLQAGLIYNTWPMIDGALVPDVSRLFFERPWWRNLFENTLTVQFNHRMMAYAIVVVAVLHLVDAARTARAAFVGALSVVTMLIVQASLGIVTLLYQAPLPLALAHQALALATLVVAVLHGVRVSAPRSSAAAALQPV